MTRRYLLLLVAIVAVAAALSAIGLPRPGRRSESPAVGTAAPAFDLALVIQDDRLSPELASVPKGSRVRLRVDNRGRAAARLSLAGYDDVLAIPTIVPGGSWSGEFPANRPGDDFAWLLNGDPAARLSVTGSHLVEGHR